MYIDTMGRYRTENLFLETNRDRSKNYYPPVYTLKPHSVKGLPSAYQIYMNAANEYDAAIQLVGDMRHWRKLCNLKWFMEGSYVGAWDGLAQWREDKAMKDQADSIKLLREQAEGGSVTAQKTLFEISNSKDKEQKAGRPRKTKDTSLVDENTAKIIALHKKLKGN